MLITIVMTLFARVSTLDGQIIAFAVFRLMFRRLKDLVHVDRNASITVRFAARMLLIKSSFRCYFTDRKTASMLAPKRS